VPEALLGFDEKEHEASTSCRSLPYNKVPGTT